MFAVVRKVSKEQHAGLVVLGRRDGVQVPGNDLSASDEPYLRGDGTSDPGIPNIRSSTGDGTSHDGGGGSKKGNKKLEHRG